MKSHQLKQQVVPFFYKTQIPNPHHLQSSPPLKIKRSSQSDSTKTPSSLAFPGMGKKRKGGSGAAIPPKKNKTLATKNLRQRANTLTPPPITSDSETIATSSDCSMSSTSTSSSCSIKKPNSAQPTKTPPKTSTPTPTGSAQSAPKTTQPRPPPLILNSSSWRKIAPLVYELPNLKPDCLTAKTSSNGQIQIQTSDITHFRLIQKTLLDNKVEFHTFSLPEERSLKVVLKGIPTDITTDELKSELESKHNYRVTYVRRFGTPDKPMPMCLVHIAAETNSKDIFLLNSLFYLQISVETFKSLGPAQCFSCQRFGHGSRNCGHPLRCVKCAGNHTAKDCQKTVGQTPTCCNCSGPHTANFRGCPEFIKQRELNTPTPTAKPVLPTIQTPAKPISRQHLPPPPPPTLNTIQPSKTYATATTGPTPPTPSTSAPTTSPSAPPTINLQQILILLTNLLTAISTNQNPVSIIETTIKTFLTILSPQNG